ncbi:hypothetical protein QBC42DRAFT_340764 [Cladorrhinum samala]|uniref:Uncharacterized protein n=1 Tax=Cladorrhinum samala TaxID=585594 RepID=A0AAV9HIC4_9PEZI|nr:hypothetical protein QBC42DRAFT_340764 [Cladorrhinum samala]
MAWDSRSSRRRQSSAASRTGSLAIQARNQARQAVQAKSPHVADPFLKDFLVPSFDAASYLNAILPPLQVPGQPPSSSRSASTQATTAAVPLADLSQQAQANLSQLNAHTTRLTNTLTQLTDEILRSGGRLAYEVELLRGETLSLAETLTEGLEDDIGKFVVPGTITAITEAAAAAAASSSSAATGHSRRLSLIGGALGPPTPVPAATTEPSTPSAAAPTVSASSAPQDPEYITKLRTLSLIRARLESVIQTFGQAMEFVFPPSEVSVTSGFLSVSAPDAGGANHSTEEKGQQVLKEIREGVLRSLSNKEDPIKGVDDAVKKIEELKELTLVWKGTAEEKGRGKFVESLARLVEERHREVVEAVQQGRGNNARTGGGVTGNGNGTGEMAEGGEASKGYAGLISQLQKLRSGI